LWSLRYLQRSIMRTFGYRGPKANKGLLCSSGSLRHFRSKASPSDEIRAPAGPSYRSIRQETKGSLATTTTEKSHGFFERSIDQSWISSPVTVLGQPCQDPHNARRVVTAEQTAWQATTPEVPQKSRRKNTCYPVIA
jgi:hypothetical protein